LTSLVLTLTETLRYRGALGQWSWVLHRITGLGTLLFLVLHVIGVAWSVLYPTLWEKEVLIYQHPLFTVGEFALVACVVYHALNGMRIGILDYNPKWWKHQQRAAVYVLIGTVVLLVPTFILMFQHVLKHYQAPEAPFIVSLAFIAEAQFPFLVGIVVAAVAAVLLSGVVGLVSGGGNATVSAKANRGSGLERFWWSFMRTSGILIVPLVFGHLALAHIVQGVFELNMVNAGIAGVPVNESLGALANGINNSGTAVEYVAERWNFLLGSVAIWRLYDAALLALVVVHGFNGLRYVLTDYTQGSPLLRRAAGYLCLIGAVVLLVVGTVALLGTIDQSMVDMAREAQAAIRAGGA
jgi:succinate dehydrogenase / fumarate reductase, cytochrome b subunit